MWGTLLVNTGGTCNTFSTLQKAMGIYSTLDNAMLSEQPHLEERHTGFTFARYIPRGKSIRKNETKKRKSYTMVIALLNSAVWNQSGGTFPRPK